MSIWSEINESFAALGSPEMAEWLSSASMNSYKDGDIIYLNDNGIKRPHFVKDAGNGMFELVPCCRVIGSRIARVRNVKGMTQDELSSKIGVHKQTVSRWERGERTPNGEELLKLALTLDCSSDFLLGISSELKVSVGN